MANRNMMIFIFKVFAILSYAAATNESDVEALLDIKSHIHSDPYQILNSWNDSIDFCKWQGITCGKKHKRVIKLDVSSLDLVGTLSPSVGNLTFLKKIYLFNNSFYGMIPPEIGKLFRLQYLIFANNSFQGQFPSDLTRCKKLQVIHLFNNNVNGRIPDLLGVLPSLYEIAFGENNFFGNIPPSLGNISTLVNLDLGGNKLSGNIPRELGKLFNLKFLGLGENNLSGYFPIEIYNISSITDFSLTMNNLTGQFPDNLGLAFPMMTRFLVASNHFSGSIPSTLVNASNLVQIEIGANMLTGKIPRNLGRLHHLQYLLLDNNPLGIHKDNDVTFITTLINCTNLLLLRMNGIEIEGELPLQISNLSRKLTFLELNDNHISGSLPTGIGELAGLNVFAVSGNTLSGYIPLSIGKLTNMKQLYLHKNNFIGEIPTSIGHISGLLILNLLQNMLTGGIPLSVSNLTKLIFLGLSNNHLNGSLPKELFNMTSLSTGLGLSGNKFTGSLPSEVGNLKNLVQLDVSENDFSGEIPMSIGGCQMLEDLVMDGNFLDGTIPSSLGQLINIDFMDLSRNKLSGEIPSSLQNLKHINFLNLSCNMLEGEVPRNGIFVNASAFSIVENGKLCGGIKSLSLPVCPPNNSKNHEKFPTHIIIVIVICALLILVSLIGYAYVIYQTRKSRGGPSSISPPDKQLLKISYAEILASTNSFSSENLIGEGKYGFVYRGVLKPEEKIVAVKVLKLQLKGAHKSFLAECEALRNIRHRNLVKIITSCSSIDFKGNDFKALILEYVLNGNLETWLHRNPFVQVNDKKLDLLKRLNIAIDIATALDYLHNHSGKPIVHCDIKPSNVLLGEDLRGMVTDFGLAKFIPMDNDISHDIESSSIGIRGTIGYVAPEYGTGGEVSSKGDIYSYGILLLEMFTGKRPTDIMFMEDFSLHNYVKTALPDRVAEIIDPQLLTVEDNNENKGTYFSTRIESCCLSIFCVGVSCSSIMQKDRMNINEALIELHRVRNEM